MHLLNVFPMCCGAALKVFSICWVWLKIMSNVFFCKKTSAVENRRTDWKPYLLRCFSLNTCRKVANNLNAGFSVLCYDCYDISSLCILIHFF